jgi:Flp pilus assembly protein TadD
VRSFERAIRMSPVDPRLHSMFGGMGVAFIELGRFDEAIVAGRKAQRHNPSLPLAYRCLASAFPLSDATLRRVRRRRVCLSLIPPLQYLR